MDKGTRWTIILSGLILLVFALMTIQRNAPAWYTEELLWKDVVRKSPDKARGRINLAKFYASVGNYKRAFEEYQLGMKLANRDGGYIGREQLSIAQSDMGHMFLRMGEAKLAETLFRASLSLRPDFGPASVNLSNVLITQGKDIEAIQVIDKALSGHAQGTSWGKLYQNKGIALCNLGAINMANANFHKAVRVEADLELEELECR